MIAAQYEKTGNQLSANGWNGLVDATRRSMVGISDGMLMDQSPMGGTTMTAVRQMRPIRAKSESMFIPFALRAVNIGTVQHPNWKKIFYFPKFACDIIGGWAECDNEKFVGEQMWAKSGDWYYIADSTGNAGQAHIPAQEDVETVYLHVLKAVDGNEEIRSAIVTNSQLIPEDFNGYETDCICIGKFDCPTPQQIGAGLGPRVLEQYVSGQVQVYGDIFPLKLTVVNIGTDASPEWVKAFWFSEGSVLYDGDVFANCHNKPYPGYTMGGEGLYFVANPEGSNTQVPLQEDVAYAFLHVKYIDGGTPQCIAIVTNDDVTIPAEFEGDEDYCCCIGRFTCPSAAQIGTGIVPAVDQQFISSQIQVPVFSGDSDYPLKLKWINKGTEQSPNMVIGIYIPRGSVTLDTGIEGTLLGTAITGMTDWYEVVPSPGVSPDPIINYIVGKAVDKDDSEWDIRPWYFIYGTRPITSADAGAAGMVYRSWGSIYIGENDHGSLVDFKSGHAWIHPPVISQGGGGGGGDTVVVNTGTATSENLVVRYVSKANGTVTFETAPYLRASEVQVVGSQQSGNSDLSVFFGLLSNTIAIKGEKVALGIGEQNVPANKWVKTDSTGKLTATDEVPVVVEGPDGGDPEGGMFAKTELDEDPDTGETIVKLVEQDCVLALDVGIPKAYGGGGEVSEVVQLDAYFKLIEDSEGENWPMLDADLLGAEENTSEKTRFLGQKPNKEKVEFIDAVVLEPMKDDTDPAPVAANAPKPFAAVEVGNETDAQKIERIGSSPNAAREDHVHPLPTDTATPSTLPSNPALYNGYGTGDVKNANGTQVNASRVLSETWQRGSTKDGSNNPCGVKIKVVTDIRHPTDNGKITFFYRELQFDSAGMLIRVGGEEKSMHEIETF